jgi:hypothetical protein
LIFNQSATTVEKENYSTTFYLSQNFPNPFNPVTNIKYHLAKEGFVTLKIYNLLGYEIATLVNEYKPQGNYDVMFDVSKLSAGKQGLASGVYIYKIQAGNFSDTKKFILMK